MKKKKLAQILTVAVTAAMIGTLCAGCGSASSDTAETENDTELSDADETEEESEEAESSTDAGTSGEVVTLKLAHGNSATGMTGLAYDKFAEYVDELSGGALQIDVYPAGTLVNDSENFNAVMDGTVDMVHDNVPRQSSTITDLAVLEVPGYFTGDTSEWLEFVDELREPLDEIYQEYGIKYLAANYQGTSVFVANDKQISTPSDLEGLTVRAMGTWISKSIENWGGAPTTLSLSELPNALERGTVDAAFTGWVIAIPNSLYEISDYITYTNMCESYADVLINLDVWESLTEEQQGWLEEAGRMFEEYTVTLAEEMVESGKQEAADGGCNVYELTEEENQAFLDAVEPLFDECGATLSDKGQEILDIVNAYK
ncbi:MAG: TRAP transporter substrate-binding protein [Lachnospiraceae bacterium]|nr:TRAP transporter substrate-binding protein [Lachnospiraceae bacterium]